MGVALAAVDEDCGSDRGGVVGFENVDGFLDTAAAGDDVFYDEDAFVGVEFEATAKDERVVLFFWEDEAFIELAGDFLTDDEGTHGRGEDGFALDVAEFLDK